MKETPPRQRPIEEDDNVPPGTCVVIPANGEVQTDNLCLGKILGNRPTKKPAIHSVLQHAWNRYEGVRIQEMSGDIILFDFANEQDQLDALDWSPWAIQGQCLSLKKWSQGIRIAEVQFHLVCFWVQIHGLEVDKFSLPNARKLGECIGEVKQIDDILGPMGLDRDYLRVKVEIDTTRPLLAGINYTRTNGTIGRAEVKYERLPDFCFGCGLIGHNERICRVPLVMNDNGDDGPMYGPWIKGERPKKRGQNCKIIGSPPGPHTSDLKRKTWKEVMKEKEDRERERKTGMTMFKGEPKGSMTWRKPVEGHNAREGAASKHKDIVTSIEAEDISPSKDTGDSLPEKGKADHSQRWQTITDQDMEDPTSYEDRLQLIVAQENQIQMVSRPQPTSSNLKGKAPMIVWEHEQSQPTSPYFSNKHPNLSKLLEKRQAGQSQLYLPVIEGTERETNPDIGGTHNWQITEVPPDQGTPRSLHPGMLPRQSRLKRTPIKRRVYYTVESPDDSPERDRIIATAPTGLSPMMQKFNLKRKHEDGMDEEELGQETNTNKKQKQGTNSPKEKERIHSTTRAKGRKSPRSKRSLGTRITQRQAANKGSDGCPITATTPQ